MKRIFTPAVALLDRFGYVAKFNLIGVITIVVSTFFVIQIYSQSSRDMAAIQQEMAGLRSLDDALVLLTGVQAHRDLVGGVLGGQAEMNERADTTRDAVDANLASLMQQLQADGDAFGLSAKLKTIESKWAALRFRTPADWEVNQSAHTVLIAEILTFIDELALRSGLLFDTNPAATHLINSLVVSGPEMTERISRVRGMATALLAKNVMTLDQEDQLISRLAQLDQTRDALILRLHRAADAVPALSKSLEASAIRLVADAARIRALVRQQILDNNFEMTPEQFFDESTRAITPLVTELKSAVLPDLRNMLLARQQSLRARQIALMAVSLGAAFLVCYLVGGMYHSVMGAVRALSAGAIRMAEGDFTQSIVVRSRDELGEVATRFNDMAQRLRTAIAQFKETVGELGHAAKQMTHTASDVADASSRQYESASAMATAIDEVKCSIDALSRNADKSAEQTKTSSGLATRGAQAAQESVSEMKSTAHMVDEAARAISALGERSNEISRIVAAIADITEQTNMLALNAAIEAARAGENGRGFAIVAEEVRKLAERTATSTTEITEMVLAMQHGTAEAVRAMNGGVERVRQGVSVATSIGSSMEHINISATNVVQLVDGISRALQEQSQASARISQNVESVSQLAARNSEAVHHVATSAANLEKIASKLTTVVERFSV